MRQTPFVALMMAACGAPCEKPGVICTMAGVYGIAGFGALTGPALETPLYDPQDVDIGPDGRVLIADDNNHAIRMLDGDTLTVVAGSSFLGDSPEGPALQASFNHPCSATVDRDDPNRVWIAATGNHRIKALDLTESYVSITAGTGEPGFSGDGIDALRAELQRPTSVAIGPDGAMYISDKLNQVIRSVAPDGTIATWAGQPGLRGWTGDGGPAREATLHAPEQAEYDPGNRITIADGVMYVADTGNHVVRAIDMDTTIITTIAGRATPGFDPDITDALAARLNNPHDVAVGPDGVVYIADAGNHCVRAWSPDGTLTTIAGRCGESGFAGDGADATDALLYGPGGVGVGADGALWIADTYNHLVRRVILQKTR